MVERVARGRIMVPAAAALTVIAAGAMQSEPAHAAGRHATLQIRVQVVEPCRIKIGSAGTLEQSCSSSSLGGMAAPVTVRLADLVEQAALNLPQRQTLLAPPRLAARPLPMAWSGSSTPAVVAPTSVSARFAAANQRASEIAVTISQRVRYITVAY